MNILVTGATGRVGRNLVEQLVEAGHNVRALTRNAAKANFPAGTEIVEGDLTQPETLASALEGVEAMHLINFGGDDYAPLQTGEEIMAMAERAGVKRVTVLLSSEPLPLDEAVKASSLAWTMLAPVEFMSGGLDWAEAIRESGAVRVPYAERKSAMVHDADIASVAVVALTNDSHGGKTYTLTGGEVLTPRDQIRIIGEVLGQEIGFTALSNQEAMAEWRAANLPEDYIEFMLWVYGNTPAVGYTVVPTVEHVTGRPPRTFKQWAQENVDAFVSVPVS